MTRFGITLSILLLLATGVDATTVLWDAFIITRSYGETTTIGYHNGYLGGGGIWPEVGLTVDKSKVNITIFPNSVVVANASCNWLVASVGDVVSESTTRHLDSSQYFLHITIDDDLTDRTSHDGWFITGDPITVRRNSIFYLMLAAGDVYNIKAGEKQDVFYGWVEVTVSPMGEIGVGSSCINLDGDPIIVGYDLVPEPGVTGLLLFGLASLVLPRRKILR